MDLRPPPRTEPLLDVDSGLEDLIGLHPLGFAGLVVGLVLVVLAVVVGLR